VLETAGPAFFGALFAFVFMWLWDAISKFILRWDRHYTGVVKLGRAANEQISALHTALCEIDHVISAYRLAGDPSGPAPFVVNQPEEIFLDDSFMLDLANLDLVNDYASHWFTMQNVNRDIRRIGNLKLNLERAYTEDRMSKKEYLAHFSQVLEWLSQLRNHITASLEDATVLTAKARVRSKRDIPRFHGLSLKLRRTRYENDFGEAVQRERAVLDAEIEAVYKQSGDRVESINEGTYEGDA